MIPIASAWSQGRWLVTFLAIAIFAICTRAESMDLADPASRSQWFSHPIIGEASYDAFERTAGNPVYVGKPPYEWPVNGSLFQDPRSGDWYCHISLYPKGYWPAGPSRLLRSKDRGHNWADLGLALTGDPELFDGDGKTGGATLDVTEVADDAGYHLTYGWAKPDNGDGGIAYAFSRSPDGPFDRHFAPMHMQSKQPLLGPGYQRVYASTIVKRAHDWLIVSAMSTPGNAGGQWALVALTAPQAEGPYTPPTFLRAPHLPYWFPQPIEFCPGFAHEGYVYASLTSVASNRSWQLWLRARLQDAHRPEAWDVYQAGSLFHAEPNSWEKMGIWGQSFSGFVDKDGTYHVMYPSRNAEGIGTINLAERPWARPFKRGFWVSAPNAPSLAMLRQPYRDFRLDLALTASGPFRVLWNDRAPLGPDRSHAESRISPLSLSQHTELAITPTGWTVEQIHAGKRKVLGRGPAVSAPASTRSERTATKQRIVISQQGGRLRLEVNGSAIGDLSIPPEECSGGVGILADAGTCVHVEEAKIDGQFSSGTWSLLPLEGLVGAGQVEMKWKAAKDAFRYQTGWQSDLDGAFAKWNYEGSLVRLWSPRLPGGGRAQVLLDGQEAATLELGADRAEESSVVWEASPSSGRHTVMLRRESGLLLVDSLEFRP